MAATNSKLVTVAKPKVTGGALMGATDVTLPTDASAALDAGLRSMGYVGAGGVKLKQDRKSDTYRAWGGAIVHVAQSEFGESYTLTLIESRNAETLKAIYGPDNVTVTGEGDTAAMVIRHNEQQLPMNAWVFDMKAGKDRRIVLPVAMVSDVGDITYDDGSLIEYEITITALPDEDGNTAYEYVAGAAA